ncbi:LysR substrate-binding domain-containing protein [Acinetobacter sp. VNK23]|nr:LysR substrate-binding domain-containing protein [Acinetobacter thutiue]
MAIVGAPEYFECYGVPETPQQLKDHNCLSYRFSSSGVIDRWSFITPDAEARTIVYEPKGNAIFNDDDSMLRAALSGIGLVQHLNLCVQPYLQDGQLVRVLLSWVRPRSGFFLYMPSRAHMPAKLRVLMEFLIEKRELLVLDSLKAPSKISLKIKKSQ